MIDPRFFDLLGVSPASTIEEIISARRLLALEFHPDRGGNAEHMALINVAFDAIIESRSNPSNENSCHSTVSTASPDPSPAASAASSRIKNRGSDHFTVDRPSFTINALPAVSFEVLLLAARILGDVSYDDPPYLLEVQIEDPVMTWCRLEIVPDAGSSTVSFVVDNAADAHLVRDLWIATINELGFENHETLWQVDP